MLKELKEIVRPAKIIVLQDGFPEPTVPISILINQEAPDKTVIVTHAMAELLRLVIREKIDIIFMDYNVGDSIRLAVVIHAIKLVSKNPELKIIGIAGDKAYHKHMIEAGCNSAVCVDDIVELFKE